MSEKNFRARLNAAAVQCRDVIDWMPVENRASKRMPDQYSINQYGISNWVELKYIEKLSHKVKFQPGQARWLKKHWERGGSSYVAVYCKQNRTIYLFTGENAERLEEFGHCHAISTELELTTPERELVLMRWFAGKNKR